MSTRPSFGVSATLLVAIGVLIAVGLYTFWYGRGYSYLSDAPEVCLNCHVMRDSYRSWSTSSHRGVVCNECHLPHDMVSKYTAKAENGFRHSAAFTFTDVQVLRPTEKTTANINKNCIRCHRSMAGSVLPGEHGESASCTRCHRRAGHTH